MPPTTTATLLHQEAWRTERVINGFRSVMWIAICGLIIAATRSTHQVTPIAAYLGMVYGAACGAFGVWVLRRRYHDAFPYVVTLADFALIMVLHQLTHAALVEADALEAAEQLHAVLPSMMLLLVVNALRFSWKVSVFSVVVAMLAYGNLMRLFGELATVTVLVNMMQLVAVGSLLAMATIKLRRVLHRQQERDAFARFLPEPLVEQLTADPSALALGGERKEATVLFADIRGFTSIAEGMEPEGVVALLNEYFQEMVEEIFNQNGILDKFIGDGIIAVFVDKLGQGDHAERAVTCGRGMLRRLDGINRARAARGEAPLRIGVGIHTGKVLAGNIGSERRLEYTHIGDTVNTTSRIEGLTKELGEALLISDATHARLEATESVPLGSTSIRGRQEIALFAVR